ncbi:DUF4350 domain-containing protein [Pedobacter mucosus]|uniref:DUF4350 domain-containing protein n=1 Tax=Pedobacter mucosus TaxID=2895286 RepID=UPI001EE3B61B|nr:DUF4350 domain-containing protein [Pedobacter mucosus]UKT63770.1 DUF4350 domain-containing protein [Pedobacter mucosus]
MKGYKLYLIGGFTLILIYLIAQYNKPTPTDWSPTYAKKDKIPYGTFIFFNQLKDVFPEASISTANKPIYTLLKNSHLVNSAYLIIAQKANISKLDFEQIKKYMNVGNNVFIATYDLGNYLEKELKIKSRPSFSTEGSSVNFTNPNLKTDANYGFEKGIGDQFFNRIDVGKATILGINKQGRPNFVKYDYGKGALYLIAEPGFYTNFNLFDKYGPEYAGKTLSYIKDSKSVFYDNYFSSKEDASTDILRVFFQHPELKYAYYLSIFGLIIFVFYDIKRKQRIIPIADPFINSSVEFANVVGSVYYHERDNLDIALKKINYFLEYLRSRYYLKTHEIDHEFADLLMLKSGINKVFAKTLTSKLIQIPTMESLSDGQLIDLNHSIEQFYKITQSNGARTI